MPSTLERFISLVRFLETYRGRDKALRLSSYLACLLGGLSRNEATAGKLFTLMEQISGCRTILRLFDDASMASVCLAYGTGEKVKDSRQRWLGLAENVINQLFYPLEHIAWFAEKGILPIKSTPWMLASLWCWVGALCIGIVMSELKMRSSLSIKLKDEKSEEMLKLRRSEMVLLVENCANLGMAIHWLPKGYLWAEKLPNFIVGVLGVISTLAGISNMS